MITSCARRSRRLRPHVARRGRDVSFGAAVIVACNGTDHAAWTLEARVAGLLDARRKPATSPRGLLITVAAVLFTSGLAVAGVLPWADRKRKEPPGTGQAPAGRNRRGSSAWLLTSPVARSPGRLSGSSVERTSHDDLRPGWLVHADRGPASPSSSHGPCPVTDGTRQGLVDLPDELHEPEKTVKVVLKSAKSVTVRVNDKQGAGVPNARIVVPAENSTARGQVDFCLLTSQTDAQGVARLRVPADARVPNIIALKPGVGMNYYEAYRAVARP